MSTIIKKTDSMNIIQTKLNNGGNIVFQKGTYKITRQLIIPKNTSIDLNGSTLQRKASIQSIFLNKVERYTTEYYGDGDISIYNGKFEGMGGYSYDNLITFFHSHDINIYNCTFQDILCHGIEINSSKNVKVHYCKFLGYNMKDTENSYKEMIQLDFASFIGFVLNGSTKYSSCYDGTGCKNIEICNNTFDKSNYRDYPYACIGGHTQITNPNSIHYDINIHDNIFKCKKNPELKQACISINSMNNVMIENNTFDTYRVARIYSKSYSYDTKGYKKNPTNGDGICNSIYIRNNIISGCKNNKEAFQQYNKSGLITHGNIVKSKNIYI